MEEFWLELSDLGNLSEAAWCMGSDFNEFFNQKIAMGEEIPMFTGWISTSGSPNSVL